MYKIKNTRLISESRISIYTKYFIVPAENRQHPKVTSSRAFVYSLSCYKILVDKIDTVLKKPLQTSDDDW